MRASSGSRLPLRPLHARHSYDHFEFTSCASECLKLFRRGRLRGAPGPAFPTNEFTGLLVLRGRAAPPATPLSPGFLHISEASLRLPPSSR